MNTAIINIKVEPSTKKQAQKLAEDLGLSLSGLVHSLLKQVIKTKTVTLSALDEEPTEYLLNSLKKSAEDIRKGRIVSFKNDKDMFSYLDKLIQNDRKHKKN